MSSTRVVASFPLTVASYKKCSRHLGRGEVKRSPQRGAILIGYIFGCPACGFSCSYVHDDCGVQKGAGYIEEPPTSVQVNDVKHPRKLVAITNPPTCFRCRRQIRIHEGKLEAVEVVP